VLELHIHPRLYDRDVHHELEPGVLGLRGRRLPRERRLHELHRHRELRDRHVHDGLEPDLLCLREQLLPEQQRLRCLLGCVPGGRIPERRLHRDDGSRVHELHGDRELHDRNVLDAVGSDLLRLCRRVSPRGQRVPELYDYCELHV
jgi:hypothetical protein